MECSLLILLAAILLVTLGLVLKRMVSGNVAVKTQATGEQLVTAIDAILPQTQCRKCGFEGCKPYACAIAEGQADINQCPPGGANGIRKLVALLGREFKPLNPEHGMEKPKAVAFIDENACIGCTLCIQACPVDAIVGAAKQMHTVFAEWCTGCELCVPPCPVDCISMVPVAEPVAGWRSKYPLFEIQIRSELEQKAADLARARHEFHLSRKERERQRKAAKLAAKTTARPGGEDPKQALIAAAIARAQQQKERIKPANTRQLTPDQLAQIAEIEARRKHEP